MGRRTFLGASGALAGAALLHGCAKQEAAFIEQNLRRGPAAPGAAAWRSSLCAQCDGGCRVKVRTIDGRAKKIEGSGSSVNDGGVCALGHAALQQHYHPRRPLHPEDASGSRLDWEQALTEIAESSQARQPGAIALCCGGDAIGLALVESIARDLNATVTVIEPSHAATERQAKRSLFGAGVELMHNLAGADLIIAIGASILDRWNNPVFFAQQVASARARGVRLASVSARFSLTAAKSDIWVPVRSGTAALTMALTRAVASGQLPDDAVEQAATAVDTPSQRIRALWHAMEDASRPAVIVGGEGANEIADVLAGHRLQQALGCLPSAFDRAELLGQEPVDRPVQRRSLRALAQAVADGSTQLVVAVDCDPLGALQSRVAVDLDRGRNGARLVALSSSANLTTERAHWRLPVQTDLERHQLKLRRWGGDAPSLDVAAPVVGPRGEARHPFDALVAVAMALGGPEAGSTDDFEKTRLSLIGRTDLGGRSPTSVLRGSLRAEGRLGFAAEVQQAAQREPLDEVVPAEPFVDTAEAPLAESGELLLELFEDVRGGGGPGSSPWLAELPAPLSSVQWGHWIELAPGDAEKLDIRTGDSVRVSSAAGSIRTTAFVQPATRPGLAFMPNSHFGETSADARNAPVDLIEEWGADGALAQRTTIRVERLDAEGAPVFGRGLRSAEHIPAGWKSHQNETVGQATESSQEDAE